VVTRTDTSASVAPFEADSLRTRHGAMSTLFGLAFVVGGFRIGLAKLDDNSFLWHFRTGRLILDDGIPRHDVFSYTVPGTKWIAQSWLAEVLYALADRALGPFGIRLLTAVLGSALGWLMWRIALHAAGDRLRAAGVTLIAFIVALNVFAERPLAFGLVAAACLVIAIEQPDSMLGRRPLVVLPILFWVWGNTHGSMSLGYAYVALHLVGGWADGASPLRAGRERSVLIGAVLSGVVLLANPYGLALVLFPFDLVSHGEVLSKVTEWMSPDFRSPLGMAFAAWLVVTLFALGAGRRRPARRDLLIVVVFVLMGLWAQRNVGITAVMTLPVVARSFRAPARAEDANRRFVIGCGLLLASLFALFAATAVAEPDFDLRGYPTKAMAFLDDEDRIGERIFFTDRNAGFVIAKYWPRQHVFLDDRFDMYPGSLVEEYEKVTDARPEWRAVLDKYDVEIVVWERRGALTQLLSEDEQWRQIYVDKEYAIFERTA
jgi:hypothetical protein